MNTCVTITANIIKVKFAEKTKKLIYYKKYLNILNIYKILNYNQNH